MELELGSLAPQGLLTNASDNPTTTTHNPMVLIVGIEDVLALRKNQEKKQTNN